MLKKFVVCSALVLALGVAACNKGPERQCVTNTDKDGKVTSNCK